MKVVLPIESETTLFDLEEVAMAEEVARNLDGEIYCWKTVGVHNWLERGLSVVDVLGLLVLSKALPLIIEMPDDAVGL